MGDTDALDHFAEILRDEARLADERAVELASTSEHDAMRYTRAGVKLRELADSVYTRDPEELAYITSGSEEEMRAFARGVLLVAAREDERAASSEKRTLEAPDP
jgi:hypothetical protein